MMRASLLATAATTTLNRRRWRRRVDPRPQLALAPLADPDQGAGAVDQLAPQVGVAAFAEAEPERLAGGAVLTWDQASQAAR